jgi:hypothetical protein
MKKMLVASLVLLCLAVVANAAYVTPSVSLVTANKVVTYMGTSTTMDVYNITLTADGDGNVAAILICAGDSSDEGWVAFDPGKGDSPFQVWKDYGGGDIAPTPKWEDCNSKAKTYLTSDSHLLAGIGAYSPQTCAPVEENDSSIWTADPDEGGFDLGQGALAFQAAVPVVYYAHSVVVAQVSVIKGTTVWGRDMSSDGIGSDDTTFLIPEPATLTLLGLGALTLIRRRRS